VRPLMRGWSHGDPLRAVLVQLRERIHRQPQRELRLLALVAPGARLDRADDGLVADAAQPGAPAGAGQAAALPGTPSDSGALTPAPRRDRGATETPLLPRSRRARSAYHAHPRVG